MLRRKNGGRKTMSRYIDADALYQTIDAWRKKLELTYGEVDDYVECLGDVLDLVNEQPTADVVEVVHCKDCKHFDDDDQAAGKKRCFCYLHGEFRPMDYFCASAERGKANEKR